MEFSRIMPVHLDEAQIEGIIPHRKPFRFVDKVLEVEYGKRAVGLMSDLTQPGYEWIQAHFPSFQVVPGAILLEALAELGAIGILGLPENRDKIAILTGHDGWHYHKPVFPGERIRLEAEIIRLRTRFGRGKVQALKDGIVVAKGTIDVVLIDKSEFPPTLG